MHTLSSHPLTHCHKLKVLAAIVLIASLAAGCKSEKSAPPPAAEPEIPAAEPEQAPAESSTITIQPSQQPESTAEQAATAETAPAATLPAEQVPQAATPVEAAAPASTTAHADSLALARKSGCLACHAIDKKVVGPAWQDVAKRYANNSGARAQLIEKVAKGGKGNWTDVVGTAAMPPYHPRASMEDIGKLVDFVLSLPAK
ncbi:MAG: c-type cytochrome [Gammaproteobacteria bacterium]|nr:c-type cytochrome [Gammaproteobacteria bacterium]